MTCEECELPLARSERTPEVQAHLGGCANCRALAAELAANEVALHELRDEALPAPASPVKRGVARPWKWAVPLAAGIALAAALFPWRAKVPVEPPRAAADAPLKIKMLTSDPDVVIYWIVDSNGGE